MACLRFGVFELDLDSQELRRSGVLMKLAPQQFRLLRYFAENPGQVCTREEIQRKIWGDGVFVDFDRSLNVCVAQLRAALNDDAEGSRYIQTLPRQGYRFVAPVDSDERAVAASLIPSPSMPQLRSRRWIWLAAFGVVAILAAAAFAYRAKTPSGPLVIAVLPFENVGGQPADSATADGISDELISQLGGAAPRRLLVIGRTSVRRYAGAHPSLSQIARELSANFVVEGSLRNAEGKLRVSARLVEAAGQTVAWSDTFEGDQAGQLEMQENAAARVTAAVVRTLFPGVEAVARPHRPVKAAYEAYLNGRYFERNDHARAIELWAKAAALDPAYADPWVSTAAEYLGIAMSGSPSPAEPLEKARAAAQHALQIDDANSEAHDLLGTVLFWRDWNWEESGRHFERAIALNPSSAQARHDYAFYLVVTGRPEAAVSSLRQAIALDPLSPRVNVDAGWVLLQAHHFEEAIAQAKRALELKPGFEQAESCIERAEVYLGKRQASPPREGARSFQRATSLALVKRNEEAIHALNAAYAEHAIMMPLLATEPSFEALHSDPRFRELESKMRLAR